MDPGSRIANRFEIGDPNRDLLGRGGMGAVYRATDTLTGELVAVKALDPNVVARDPELLERFTREGEALRRLNHPNIVRMVAAVEEGGYYYLVMEYVPGGSLRDVLEATRPDRSGRPVRSLPVARVLEISLDLADALIRQGDEADRLYFVERGTVSVYLEVAGSERVRLQTLGLGTAVGEIGLYLGARCTASVIADSPVTAYRLTRAALSEMKEKEPELAATFHEFAAPLLSERLSATTRTLEAVPG